LVYVIQGYETVRDDLPAEDRQAIEGGVLNPMADFLSAGSPQTFDRIHNHGTWAAAAVGMTGYVLDQPKRVEQALYGLDTSGEAGFLKQLDELFSPDGYYAEGPYYQRYALMPFVLFAQAIDQNDPKRGIFDYRDGIVLKAIETTVQQSYAGKFFPINDAIREKGLNTVELKYGLTIAYEKTREPSLLGAVQLQDSILPTPAGKLAWEGMAGCTAPLFEFESRMLRDGPAGEDGALMILRAGARQDDATALLKATSQGLGHGHFDKLGFVLYDNGEEIISDYGAARFLNVEAKNGGRYLDENESWAKQSVAHNVPVIDETSHFDGDWRYGQQFAPRVLAFSVEDDLQLAAAEIDTAYEGSTLQRALVMLDREDNSAPYIIDIVRVPSETSRQVDLPIHFNGQLIDTGFPVEMQTGMMTPLGSANGYQHLWHRGSSDVLSGENEISWLIADRFYTMTFETNTPATAVFTELGANDPNSNLRREQAMILRTEGADVSFVSVYEPHGRYDSDAEVTVYEGGSVEHIEIERLDTATSYMIAFSGNEQLRLLIADDTAPDAEHSLTINDNNVTWTGPLHLIR